MSDTTSADGGTAPIAFLLPSLAGGGVARVALNLAEEWIARGRRVDLLLCSGEGAYVGQLPAGLRTVALRRGSRLGARRLALAAQRRDWRELLLPVLLPFRDAPPTPYLSDLVSYLQRERPAALFAAKTHTNLVAIWARHLAGVSTPVLVSQHSVLSQELAARKGRKWRWRFVAPLVGRAYPRADAIVAVSNGVADDLAATAGVERERIRTLYNPVVTPSLLEQSQAHVDHPWFEAGAPPVVLSAGRLRASKDFRTLLQAFAGVRETRPARLLVLGEGGEREALAREAQRLGVVDDVAFPGFVANPFAYMARAGVFVLASRYEALGNVLVEALACGCSVVSTDCPVGPAEVLEHGRYGRLVPVGDAHALARAIAAALDAPDPPERLEKRAADFSASKIALLYLDAVNRKGVVG
jgi:glycosyltransferase involved in cell wall biosynthesis